MQVVTYCCERERVERAGSLAKRGGRDAHALFVGVPMINVQMPIVH